MERFLNASFRGLLMVGAFMLMSLPLWIPCSMCDPVRKPIIGLALFHWEVSPTPRNSISFEDVKNLRHGAPPEDELFERAKHLRHGVPAEQ